MGGRALIHLTKLLLVVLYSIYTHCTIVFFTWPVICVCSKVEGGLLHLWLIMLEHEVASSCKSAGYTVTFPAGRPCCMLKLYDDSGGK